MTFLPVVERELRTAARKRSTFWVRVGTALIALVIGSGIMILVEIGAFPPNNAGTALFGTLTWISLIVVLSSGLFFTSDCLSEEKREGTLGFLFLTDLRGYDVVFGKLMATSLRGFYGLLAIFPIVGICLLLGGVTGAQFWKTILALLNALLCSLAAGLFVSSVSRDSQKALSGTLLAMILLLGAGPLADALIDYYWIDGFPPKFMLLSPAYLFVEARAWGKSPFWTSLLINQIATWLILAFSALLLPRTWQDKPVKRGLMERSWAYAWKYGGRRRRARLRNKFLDSNPSLWLAARERWQMVGLWILVLAAIALFISLVWIDPSELLQAWMVIGGALMIFLYLGICSQSGRFFIEARRTGLMELLLESPLSTREIVLGQWRALLRIFTGPVFVVLCLDLASTVIMQFSLPQPSPIISPTMAWGSPMLWASKICSIITHITSLSALAWFGMWMGMTSKNSQLAALKSFLFVFVIPWMVFMFGAGLAILALTFAARGAKFFGLNSPFLLPILQLAITTVLTIAKDAAFIIWSRKKLYNSLRLQAVEGRAVSPGRMRKWIRLPGQTLQPTGV